MEWLGVFAIAGIVFLIIAPVIILFDFYWSTPKRLKEIRNELSRIACLMEEQNDLMRNQNQTPTQHENIIYRE